MIVTLQFVLLILAVVCFLLAALGVSTPRGNLTAAGLFFWSIAATVALAR
jgi:hypothetical protein